MHAPPAHFIWSGRHSNDSAKKRWRNNDFVTKTELVEWFQLVKTGFNVVFNFIIVPSIIPSVKHFIIQVARTMRFIGNYLRNYYYYYFWYIFLSLSLATFSRDPDKKMIFNIRRFLSKLSSVDSVRAYWYKRPVKPSFHRHCCFPRRNSYCVVFIMPLPQFSSSDPSKQSA